ncbi:MAG: hypothetical protein AB7F35_29940 [Acetobacteraceae bacterium]
MHKVTHRMAFLPAVTRMMSALRSGSKSAVAYQPRIDAADYKGFQRILSDALPGTYSTWLHVRREEALRSARCGLEVEDVSVCPRDFETYCAMSGDSPSLEALWRMANGSPRSFRVPSRHRNAYIGAS